MGKWEDNNKHTPEFKQRVYENCKRWRKANQVSLMFSRAKARAKRKNIEFSITREDIIIPEQCPLLHVPFSNTYLNPNDPVDFVPSLDRKDDTKGYTKENIWVISFKANRMKNTATHQELLTFCKNYEDIVEYK